MLWPCIALPAHCIPACPLHPRTLPIASSHPAHCILAPCPLHPCTLPIASPHPALCIAMPTHCVPAPRTLPIASPHPALCPLRPAPCPQHCCACPLMRQVPAMRVSERLWCCWVHEVGLVVGERPSKSGAPVTRGWQCTEGDRNGVGAHASAPLRSTLGPGIGEGVERYG